MAFQIAPGCAQNTQNLAASGPSVGVIRVFEDIEYGSGGPEKLLADLRAAGVVLSIEGDRLAFDAPAGVMTDGLLARMRSHREELLALVESFEERAAVIEHDGELPRAEAERRAWACVLGDPAGDDPDPPAESSSADPALGDPSVPSSIVCPWCRSADLVDAPEGLRCRGCDRLAWVDLPSGGWERVDRAELDLVEVDSAAVPACPRCGRVCDVDRGPMGWGGRNPGGEVAGDRPGKASLKNGEIETSLSDMRLGPDRSWACSWCDPEAEGRRRLSERWASLAARSRGRSR